jgi:thiamine pyridinylase
MAIGGPMPPRFGKDAGIVQPVAPDPSGRAELNVGLYPYVPQPQWFVAAVNQFWLSRHPDVGLNFVLYDCYTADPPPTLDVFAFDAIFGRYFASKDYLRPFPLMDTSDFFPWALSGLSVNSEWVWAAPYLGCMNILIYRKEDPDLASADLTVRQLEQILGDSSNEHARPPHGQGLLIDLTGATTDACMYLQAVMENIGEFPLDPPLPPCPSGLDSTAVEDLRTLVRIAGQKQASYQDTTGYQRLNWWLDGYGRAYVGLTESFYFFGPDVIDQYAFRPFPLASAPVSTIPLYTDAVAVNSTVSSDKRDLAIELATLVASPEVVSYAIWEVFPKANPQYLIPARRSVLDGMAKGWPVYQSIQTTLFTYGTAGFRMGEMSRSWLSENKGCIRAQLLGSKVRIDEPLYTQGYAQTPGGLGRKP